MRLFIKELKDPNCSNHYHWPSSCSTSLYTKDTDDSTRSAKSHLKGFNFRVKTSFEFTVNKSQGQTFERNVLLMANCEAALLTGGISASAPWRPPCNRRRINAWSAEDFRRE
ncbi:hypothetical protein EVAR_51619_1 [Eumeta japonica]|uniref:Uncharacterized protein n=1 Tax=Eumeta variegata TaxID=151549 RepID=A0A4C1YC98_EUMVA|nr:hypothetical protein EVAR_51619_1 [Eumeta japonica]